MFTVMDMVQVQLRIHDEAVEKIDKMVGSGMFKSRSDAIKHMIMFYEEREKTMKFARMLAKRSMEARDNPEKLVKLDSV